MDLILGGVPVCVASAEDLLRDVETHWSIEDVSPLVVVSANLDHLYHFGAGASYEGALRGNHIAWCVTIDGMPLVWRARGLTRRPIEQLAGSDLLPSILASAEADGVPVGFLGGESTTHEKLDQELSRRFPSLDVRGYWSPARTTINAPAGSTSLAHEIRRAEVSLLVLGLGKPLQELWIARYILETDVRVALAFGASADFLAGVVARAPSPLRRLGLEWAFRLLQEPRRLWRRYLVDGPRAMLMLFRYSRTEDP